MVVLRFSRINATTGLEDEVDQDVVENEMLDNIAYDGGNEGYISGNGTNSLVALNTQPSTS